MPEPCINDQCIVQIFGGAGLGLFIAFAIGAA